MNKILTLVFAVTMPGLALAHSGQFVFTLTNQASGNNVQTYRVRPDGSLAMLGMVATGGNGNGASLNSQGAVALSASGGYVFAVNAGSNSVSLLRRRNGQLALVDVEPSGGLNPVSVTECDGLVYVLNQGNTSTVGNIQGYALFRNQLVPIPGATWQLSGLSAAATEIRFTEDGDGLVVVEKGTNSIDTFKLDFQGKPTGTQVQASNGAAPFGFDIDRRGHLLVTEAAASSVSSYSLDDNLLLHTVSNQSHDGQAAACWGTVTPDGRYFYASNAGTGNVSGYRVSHDGALSLLGNGVTGVTGGHTLDSAIGRDGDFLFVLATGTQQITSFRIMGDGSLRKVGVVGDLPVGTAGLAAN